MVRQEVIKKFYFRKSLIYRKIITKNSGCIGFLLSTLPFFKSCLTGKLHLPLPGQFHIQYKFPIEKMRLCSYRQKNKNLYFIYKQSLGQEKATSTQRQGVNYESADIDGLDTIDHVGINGMYIR
jgi:hypothetical protein